jgi:hypothetical protein
MAEKRTAPDADTGATTPAPAAAPDDLNPLDMAGKGQTLSPVEQAQADTVMAREQAKLEASEMVRKAEAEALAAQRTAIQADQERRRQEAVKSVEASRDAMFEQRSRLQPMAVDPVSLALDAAHSAMMAQALKIDETVPGGYYVVGGRVHDANGTDLGPAPRD